MTRTLARTGAALLMTAALLFVAPEVADAAPLECVCKASDGCTYKKGGKSTAVKKGAKRGSDEPLKGKGWSCEKDGKKSADAKKKKKKQSDSGSGKRKAAEEKRSGDKKKSAEKKDERGDSKKESASSKTAKDRSDSGGKNEAKKKSGSKPRNSSGKKSSEKAQPTKAEAEKKGSGPKAVRRGDDEKKAAKKSESKATQKKKSAGGTKKDKPSKAKAERRPKSDRKSAGKAEATASGAVDAVAADSSSRRGVAGPSVSKKDGSKKQASRPKKKRKNPNAKRRARMRDDEGSKKKRAAWNKKKRDKKPKNKQRRYSSSYRSGGGSAGQSTPYQAGAQGAAQTGSALSSASAGGKGSSGSRSSAQGASQGGGTSSYSALPSSGGQGSGAHSTGASRSTAGYGAPSGGSGGHSGYATGSSGSASSGASGYTAPVANPLPSGSGGYTAPAAPTVRPSSSIATDPRYLALPASTGGGGGALPVDDLPLSERPLPEMYELDGSGGPRFPGKSEFQLAAGSSGAIDFWMAPSWNPELFLTEDGEVTGFIPLVSHASSSRTSYRISVSPLLDELMFMNASTQFELAEVELENESPYHVAIVTREDETDFYVDGELVAEAMDVAYVPEERSLDLRIGEEPYIGWIGSLRIWGEPIPGDRLFDISFDDDATLEKRPEYAHLLAHLRNDPSAPLVAEKSDLIVPEPTVGVDGIWFLESDREKIKISGVDASRFSYVPRTVIQTSLRPRNDPLALAGGSAQLRGSGPVLVVSATVAGGKHSRFEDSLRDSLGAVDSRSGPQPDDEVWVRSFARIDSNAFAAERGLVEFSDTGHCDGGNAMRIQDATYCVQPSAPTHEEAMSSDFKNDKVPKGLDHMIEGIDIRNINPFAYQDRSTNENLFVSWKKNPYVYEIEFDGAKWVPDGYHYIYESGSKATKACVETYTSQEYFESLRAGIGVEAGIYAGNEDIAKVSASFSASAKFEQNTTSMRDNREMRCVNNSICVTHRIQLDKADLEPSTSFKRAVQALADEVQRGNAGAVTGFLDEFGTHYAHAIAYGGRATLDVRMSESSFTQINELIGDATISASAAIDTAYGGGNVGGNASLGKTDRSTLRQTMKQENEAFEGSGGSGGWGAESWSCTEEKSIPVYLDLRPLHEILAPPFFDDPRVIFDTRVAVREELRRVLNANNPHVNDNQVFNPEAILQRLADARKAAQAEADERAAEAARKGCPATNNQCSPTKDTMKACFKLDATPDRQVFRVGDGANALHKGGVFGRCHRILWKNVSYYCDNGTWSRKSGDFSSDALCHDVNKAAFVQ